MPSPVEFSLVLLLLAVPSVGQNIATEQNVTNAQTEECERWCQAELERKTKERCNLSKLLLQQLGRPADANLTVECTGNSTTGSNTSSLMYPNATDVRSSVFLLSEQVPMNNVTVAVVSTLLNTVTRESDNMTPTDVSRTSKILDDMVKIPVNCDKGVCDNIIAIVNNLESVDSETLKMSENTSQACSRIVAALESFTDNVQLQQLSNSSSSNFSAYRTEVAVMVIDQSLYDNRSRIYGFGVDDVGHDEVIHPEVILTPRPEDASMYSDSIVLSQEALDRAINLRAQLVQSNTDATFRVSFTVYRNGKLFQQEGSRNNDVPVNGLVMSASINRIPITGLTDPITVTFRVDESNSRAPRNCAFWENGSRWSTEGITVIDNRPQGWNTPNVVVCLSQHLTNFAVFAGYIPDGGRRPLEMLSMLGLSLSMAGLILTILSQMLMLRTLRQHQSTLVLVHLSASLLIVDVIVLGGLNKVKQKGCKVVAALLHYFLLVSFSWMLVEAVVHYMKFVKVFNIYTPKFSMKTALPSYILPGIIVLAVVIFDANGYQTLQNDHFCWLSNKAFQFAFLLPLGLIMTTNIVMFGVIVKGLTCSGGPKIQTNQPQSKLIKLQTMALIFCFIVMGLTWILAFVAYASTNIIACAETKNALHALFIVFNSLQGFMIFIVLLIREQTVRQAWLALIGRCRDRVAVLLPTSKSPESTGGTGKSKSEARHPIWKDSTQADVVQRTGGGTGASETRLWKRVNNGDATSDTAENPTNVTTTTSQ